MCLETVSEQRDEQSTVFYEKQESSNKQGRVIVLRDGHWAFCKVSFTKDRRVLISKG